MWGYALQEFGVFGLLEVLQVVQVGDKVWLVERLLLSQIIEVDGVGQTLDKLGASCVSAGTNRDR